VRSESQVLACANVCLPQAAHTGSSHLNPARGQSLAAFVEINRPNLNAANNDALKDLLQPGDHIRSKGAFGFRCDFGGFGLRGSGLGLDVWGFDIV